MLNHSQNKGGTIIGSDIQLTILVVINKRPVGHLPTTKSSLVFAYKRKSYVNTPQNKSLREI